MTQQYDKPTLENAIALHGSCVGVIYRIYCVQTGVSYVGQTRDIGRKLNLPRIKSHLTALKRGCHPCRELQAAWDATGGKSIKDEILEVIAPVNKAGVDSTSKMLSVEKRWQEQYKAANGQRVEKDRHYRLKAEEIRTLRDAGIINNAALVYFILKLKNPWCDRPLRINPLELAIEWEIPESSIYEAIAKLKEAEVIHINEAEIVISWPTYSQQDCHSDNSESVQDSRMDSKIPECTLENQNGFQDPRMDSEIPENRCPEPSSSKTSTTPQTIQTYTDFKQTLSEGERENFLSFCKELTSNFSQAINDIEAWLASKTKAGQNRWEVYYQKFSARKEEQAKKATRKTGRQLMKEFHEELEQQQQRAIEISNREKEQAIPEQQRLEV